MAHEKLPICEPAAERLDFEGRNWMGTTMKALWAVVLAGLLAGPAVADQLDDFLSAPPHDDGLVSAMSHPAAPPATPPINTTMPDLSPPATFDPVPPATNQTCVFTPPAMWRCTAW